MMTRCAQISIFGGLAFDFVRAFQNRIGSTARQLAGARPFLTLPPENSVKLANGIKANHVSVLRAYLELTVSDHELR